jgi:hypothetical protein
LYARAVLDVEGQAAALNFFAHLAEDIPTFRARLLAPTGIQLLVENIKRIGSESDALRLPCTALSYISTFKWCLPALSEQGACPMMIKLLL